MNVVLWVHVFVSPEEEKDFKENVPRAHPKSTSESVDMMTYFDLMLKDAGVVHWEEEHCVLKFMGPFIPLHSAPNGQKNGH